MSNEKLAENKALIREADRHIEKNKKIIKQSGALTYTEFVKKIKSLNARALPDTDQDRLKTEIESFINEVDTCIKDEERRIEEENLEAFREKELAEKAKRDEQLEILNKKTEIALSFEAMLENYNKNYACIKFMSRVLYMQEALNENNLMEMKFYNHHDLMLFHKNNNIINSEGKKVNVFSEWTEWPNRRTYSGLIFDPSTTEVEVRKGDAIYLNRWKGFTVEPEDGNDDDIYWELVKTGMCNDNEEYYRYVRKWLAHMIQKPTERPLTALGIFSKQGSGKGAFVETVGELMGTHFNANVTMRDLTGQFSGALKDVVLAFLDEASWGGNKADAGELKRAVTQKTMKLELKGKDPITVPCYRREIIVANHGYYYHADPDDRRLLPLEPNDEIINKGNVKFWEKFWDMKNNRKMQANLLYHLLEEDIEDFNPYTELRDMDIVTGWNTMYESIEPHEKWIYHAIQERCFMNCNTRKEDAPEDDTVFDGVIQREQLNASYDAFKKSNTYWSHAMSGKDRKMDKYLKQILGDNYPGQEAKNGKGRCYKINWEEMIKNFESMYRYRVEWDFVDDKVLVLDTARTKPTAVAAKLLGFEKLRA